MILGVVFEEGVDKTGFTFLGRASVIIGYGGPAGRGSLFSIFLFFDPPP